MSHRRPALLWIAVLASGSAHAVVADDVRFRRDVLPILAENCLACHGFDKGTREAGLRLDQRAGALAELPSGEHAIVPGAPDKSALVARILSEDADERMPPHKTGKKLTAAQKDILKRWIAAGAVYEKHWSFDPPQPAAPPTVAGAAHPIDAFVQAKLRVYGLQPSATANLETLARRASLDLIGLPPTPAEMEAILAASRADPERAYAGWIDRLLASPHYGEKWGRWWLDQARYADSHGYSIDGPREIWKYRDWVVGALNADLPFDRFTVEQLAGDLLPNATLEQKIATGFHRNTQINQEGGVDPEQFRIESVFDRTATTGTVWLGLSVGCAQCHDHKFDPIGQAEYYRLFAYFNDQDEPTLKVHDPSLDVPALTAELKTIRGQIEKLMKEKTAEFAAWEKGLTPAAKKSFGANVGKMLKAPAAKRNFDQKRQLFAVAFAVGFQAFQTANERYAKIDELLKSGATTLVMAERKEPRVTTVFIKGDFTRPAEKVTPGTPAVLHPLASSTPRSNRLELARWLMRPENPLTARVIANRIWGQYFGRGLVETENDFGLQGTPPSHPELLDWLALEMPRRGWSLKSLHRMIVLSHTYRQSSSATKEQLEKDPNNVWLGRQRRLRLDAELVRDSALAASGLLARKFGGPPVFPPIPDGVMSQGQVKHDWKTSVGPDRYRRGAYTFLYRATPPPALNVFDAPDGYLACTRRLRSNTPLQALTLLNDAAFVECATALSKIVTTDGAAAAFRRCTSRAPNPKELATLSRLDALTCARVLLNLDETITRE